MIDAMLVIGTSPEVYPATAYIEAARRKGTRVAVVNVEKEDVGLLGLGSRIGISRWMRRCWCQRWFKGVVDKVEIQ